MIVLPGFFVYWLVVNDQWTFLAAWLAACAGLLWWQIYGNAKEVN